MFDCNEYSSQGVQESITTARSAIHLVLYVCLILPSVMEQMNALVDLMKMSFAGVVSSYFSSN